MTEGNLEAVSEGKEEREFKTYNKEKGKFYNNSLGTLLAMLKGLPPKSPIAYEVSRALKVVAEKVEKYEEEKDQLMAEYLLRNEKGEYELNDLAKEQVEKAKSEGKNIQPTMFGLVVDGNEDREFEYQSALLDLLNREVNLKFKTVNAKTKMVLLEDGSKEKLIDCISNFFEVGQINFLEEVGVLQGLD